MFNLPVTRSGNPTAPVTPVAPSAPPTGGHAVSPEASTPQPTQNQVKEAVASVKKMVDSMSSSSLQFSIDNDSGKTLVRVTDAKTGELIRQIPSKEMLEIAKSIDHLQGLLVRQKV